jgi:predicted signal transduction protein with EAL and GGDEF domain
VGRWQQRFAWPLRLAVNLSAVQLRNADVLADVSDALAASGLAPDTLELEVTESVSVKEIPHLLETLEGLRALGCQIAIDDFGTGQSSLDYIRRFPADRIKIDQVFVRNIGVDPDDEAIVKATIQMAHSMGRGVVASSLKAISNFCAPTSATSCRAICSAGRCPPPRLKTCWSNANGCSPRVAEGRYHAWRQRPSFNTGRGTLPPQACHCTAPDDGLALRRSACAAIQGPAWIQALAKPLSPLPATLASRRRRQCGLI